MKFQTPPGMRDLYPPDMRLQNWLFEHWRAVSRAFGFEEYEGPIFEFIDLYTVKSGEGIVSELFHFEDRGERHFAIRPEMTPTLARMVAAKANALPRPIKWFSIPRMCRAEKPQRGRLREFFQWNIDILGVDEVIADAEVIAAAVEFLRRVGLTPADAVMRISSRQIAAAALAGIGIPPERATEGFGLIDRFDKIGPEEFARRWKQYAADVPAERVLSELEHSDVHRSVALAEQSGDAGRAAADQFRELWRQLEALGVADYCTFDLKVVRGLAYYTGPVFEVSATRIGLRALLGGGRYDNLTELLEGPRVPGVGFGMGDAPVLELLRELGKLPDLAGELDVFVIDAGPELFPKAQEIAGALRRAGLACDLSYRRQALGKQLKQAAARGARFAVIVGSELTERGEVGVKDLRTGAQRGVALARLLEDPCAFLALSAAGPSLSGFRCGSRPRA